MGFVERFKGRQEPTGAWVREPGLPVECELAVPSFCGVRLGDPPGALRLLGPPENRDALAQGVFEYREDGFEVDADDGRVSAFVLFWDCPDRPEFGRFKGRILHEGARVDVGTATGFAAQFGPPYWRHEDEDEVILFYERGGVEWQAEFRRDGTLKALTILASPLLGDAAQREAYGVTKGWPPA